MHECFLTIFFFYFYKFCVVISKREPLFPLSISICHIVLVLTIFLRIRTSSFFLSVCCPAAVLPPFPNRPSPLATRQKGNLTSFLAIPKLSPRLCVFFFSGKFSQIPVNLGCSFPCCLFTFLIDCFQIWVFGGLGLQTCFCGWRVMVQDFWMWVFFELVFWVLGSLLFSRIFFFFFGFCSCLFLIRWVHFGWEFLQDSFLIGRYSAICLLILFYVYILE